MWSEIAAIYRASKKKRDINWFTEWICRPPAACVVYALRDSRVTPNQLTFLSLAVAMAAGLLWALVPGWAAAALGALLFEVSFVLDCADGQLARLRKMTSPLGHLLDFLMDEIKAMLIFAAIALRLYRGSGDDIYLLAGLAGLLALASGLRATSFTRRAEYGAKPPTADGQPVELAARRGASGALIGGLERLARNVVHYPQYIWLLALLDRFELYFWGYGAVQILYVGMIFLAIGRRLGALEPARRSASMSGGVALAQRAVRR